MAVSGRISIPRLSRRTIVRERLLSRLHAGIGNGVTVLEAPAGYGKTTLLAQFVADVDYACKWLSLDSTSGSPEILAHQLGVALTGNLDIEPPATAAKVSDLQAYVGAVMSQALGDSDRPVLLVIDNTHELAENREAANLLGWLIVFLPEGNEVVLAGRERPFLPALNAGIATGEIVVLEGTDLGFTLEEVRMAAAESGASAAATDVLAATGGWPVGVMAALSGGASPDGPGAVAFEAYLKCEVWEHVPANLQVAFRRLSLQPSISRACVEAAFGPAMWRSMTAWLSSRDFLCEQLSPVEFRLNPLLRQFIISEFDELDPDGYAETFQAVVDEMVMAGNIAEAIEFTRSGGNEAQLAVLLEEYSPRLLIQGSFTLLRRAFDCISEPTLRRRPLLRGMASRLLAHTGDPEDAMRRANTMLQDSRTPVAPQAHALLARVRALRLLGRLEDARATALQLSELEAQLEPELLAEVRYHLAEFELSVTRDFVKAEALLRMVIDDCERRGVEPLGLLARSTLGQSLAMRGDAPAAVTVLTRAAQGWRSLGRSSNLGWVLNNLGMAHVQAGDFTSASTVLQEAVEEGENCANQRNVAYATASLGDAELALGHFETAKRHYEEAIRICATDALDESLAALSIAGLSAALLGTGDISQADFFSRRALLVAVSSANSYEIAMCKLQQAAVEVAAGNHVVSVSEAAEAVERFSQMEVLPMVATAEYRVAMASFKAGKRNEAEDALGRAAVALKEPWMVGSLVPLVRENPMFAQWAATRKSAGAAFRDLLERHSFESARIAAETPDGARSRFPLVRAHSFGRVVVEVGGRELCDEDWASARAKEMFFLLLSSRDGIRKEEAVEQLYPELPREKTNSAFHSNLYRVRRALYKTCVVADDDGIYRLNPEGMFEWDVDEFERAIEQARSAPSGSKERAVSLQQALELYAGPFASAFQSEWAAAMRERLEGDAHESLATLAGYFAGREDFDSAALCMERVLRANRYNEEAAYLLARYRSRAGEAVQALKFIDDFSSSYLDEFGERPPVRFGELRAAIAAGVAV
ncbi:MAG: tetratricopeptide repeat protein [Dehalococcoidia bacterium]|nr:tetratricopeptide repeat protein [Dehalococcoidia bacterium]